MRKSVFLLFVLVVMGNACAGKADRQYRIINGIVEFNPHATVYGTVESVGALDGRPASERFLFISNEHGGEDGVIPVQVPPAYRKLSQQLSGAVVNVSGSWIWTAKQRFLYALEIWCQDSQPGTFTRCHSTLLGDN